MTATKFQNSCFQEKDGHLGAAKPHEILQTHKKFRQLCRSTSQKQSPPSSSFLRWEGVEGGRSLSFIQIFPVRSTLTAQRFFHFRPIPFPAGIFSKISSKRNLSEEKSVEKSLEIEGKILLLLVLPPYFFSSPSPLLLSLSLSRTLAQASKRDGERARNPPQIHHTCHLGTHTHTRTLPCVCGRVVNFFFSSLLLPSSERSVPKSRITPEPTTHAHAHERTTHTGSVRRFLRAKSSSKFHPEMCEIRDCKSEFSPFDCCCCTHALTLALSCFFFYFVCRRRRRVLLGPARAHTTTHHSSLLAYSGC